MTNLQTFMADYAAGTYQNPFSHAERVWENRAAFEVFIFDGKIHFGFIRSFERGKGYGTAALNWLCALADRHQVTLHASIKPVGPKPRLNANELRAWYKRHGFIVHRRTEIERKPNAI